MPSIPLYLHDVHTDNNTLLYFTLLYFAIRRSSRDALGSSVARSE
jgi:hypothetical protein